MTVGGGGPPRAMIEGVSERQGLRIGQGWGMTEMSPVGTLSGAPGQEAGLTPQDAYTRRAKQGVAIPFVEIRASSENGLVPWDGATMGELEVRGPSISSAYFQSEEGADRWTEDGWFKTGDVVTIYADGCVEVQDRAKDLVKSGGEWISTVALENALMGHPAVAEAAVIAVPDEKWSERPLAVVVFREGEEASPDELREFLAPNFAKWWLPDRFEIVDEIPKTAVGKFRKTALREQFAQQPAETA
jgi:fatty-acyl-CoA synthase